MSATPITLPGSDISFAPLGVGTWAWGDKRTWGMGGYDTDLTIDTIREAWAASLRAGVTLFDTAEVYGGGRSEQIIGDLLADLGDRDPRPVIATKFMPSPWKLQVRGALASALRHSLDRLGLARVDLYQIHGPISLRSHKAMAEALADVHDKGLVGAVGVSNYSVREMNAIADALERREVPLASNQIEYSLLRRSPETGGLLRACRDRGVIPLAYSPIGQGRLTGKYSAASPPPGKRGFSAHPMDLVDRIVERLRAIGSAHDDRTPSQVALNWLIQKGAVPIPGAKNEKQAVENAGALGWDLDADEVAALDDAALEGRRTLQSRFWQHG